MRARNIKPAFFLNEALSGIAPGIRLLFIGLWCYSDRSGRFLFRPKHLKACLFPFNKINLHKSLAVLVNYGFIKRYEVNNEVYYEIVNFTKHQHPHINEPQSTIPAPEPHQSAPSDCGLLIAESGLPLTPTPNKAAAPSASPKGLTGLPTPYNQDLLAKQLQAQNYEATVRARVRTRLGKS